MAAMAATDSTGYLPAAVSPESIRASAPCRTAAATSLTSARVGLGFVCMESSIWVATMTGLPAALHFSIIICWTSGTSSNAEVAARRHHAFGDGDNVVQVCDALLVFDFGDDMHMGGVVFLKDAPCLQNIFGFSDEGGGDDVDPVPQAEQICSTSRL